MPFVAIREGMIASPAKTAARRPGPHARRRDFQPASVPASADRHAAVLAAASNKPADAVSTPASAPASARAIQARSAPRSAWVQPISPTDTRPPGMPTSRSATRSAARAGNAASAASRPERTSSRERVGEASAAPSEVPAAREPDFGAIAGGAGRASQSPSGSAPAKHHIPPPSVAKRSGLPRSASTTSFVVQPSGGSPSAAATPAKTTSA